MRRRQLPRPESDPDREQNLQDIHRRIDGIERVLGGHTIIDPTGGATVDTEARAAITDLLEILRGLR